MINAISKVVAENFDVVCQAHMEPIAFILSMRGFDSISISNSSNAILAISAGDYHSLILKDDGSLWACGRNSQGQLGDGTEITRRNPVLVMSSGVSTIIGAVVSSIVTLDTVVLELPAVSVAVHVTSIVPTENS